MNQINKFAPLKQERVEGEIFMNTNTFIDNFPVGRCIYIADKSTNGSNCCDFDRSYKFKHLETGKELDAPTLYGFESTGTFHNQAVYTQELSVKNILNRILVRENFQNVHILDEIDLKIRNNK